MRATVRRVPLLASVLLALVAGGCGLDSPMTTVEPKSDLGRLIYDLFMTISGWTLFVFVVVEALLLFATWRFRDQPGRGSPRPVHGHLGLEIVWTFIPVAIVISIAVPTIAAVFRTQGPQPAGALRVEVIAHQWWWEFRYPDLGVTTANELHLPVGRPVTLLLKSADVIHSFWVPQLGGKRDTIPGRENLLTFTVTTPGEYPGQCAEFCGVSHANMRMLVAAQPPREFETWVERMKALPVPPAGDAARGLEVFRASVCVACHTIQGVSQGVVGPDLTHFGSRKTLAARLFPNDREHLARWLADPPGLKPGVRMPKLPLTEAQISALVAYLGQS